MSVVPPALNGTTMVTWRCGQSCARAAGAAKAYAASAATSTGIRNLHPPKLPTICCRCTAMTAIYKCWQLGGGRSHVVRHGRSAMSLSQSARDKLAAVSTATLTTVLFKHGFRNTFIQGIHRLNADAPAMVGPAYTLR